MQHGHRRSTAGLLAAATTAAAVCALPAAAPASPAPAASPAAPAPAPPAAAPLAASAPAAAPPGDLVVGLRPGATLAAPVARLAARGVDVTAAAPVPGLAAATVAVPAGQAGAAAAALRRDPAVRYVERNTRARITAVVTADDYFRPDQWAFDRIAAPGAWQYGTGDPAVTVAVLDTGVMATADLPAGRITPGYDFVNNDADPVDDHGHGTMVASTVAGAGDDAVGGGYHGGSAGMCWSCRIMPVKVLDADGDGDIAGIAAGVDWAVAQGADIVNLSLGSAVDSLTLDQSIADAVAAGVLVLAAAGNDGTAARFYPAASPGVVAVGAATPTDGRYPWSNHGASWVDVAAPGCVIAGDRYDWWREFCGTSAATPLVAGIAALALAADPAASVADLTAALTDTADAATTGWTTHGRVDALAAVQRFTPAGGPAATLDQAPGALLRGTARLSYGATDPDGVAAVALLVDGTVAASAAGAGPHTHDLATDGRSAQVGLTVVAQDAHGVLGVLTVPATVDNEAPSVAVAAPVAHAPVRGRVQVAVTAADSSGIARVDLLVGGVKVSSDSTAPYLPSWDSRGAEGPVRLYARAWDRAGNAALTYRPVYVDNHAPSVTRIGGPRGGARVRGLVRVPVRTTDASGVAEVALWVNGRVVARDTRGPYVLPLVAAAQPRTMRAQLRSTDNAGNVRLSAAWRWSR
ncbi:hypothetical protein GCM10010124_07950 [Pilimelia terevasa]|uniref:Uncharacterized protein n=1 Tax=Pilimelia terevasa TaxID=53372 RepID=A0A8J3FFE5_9ACTN|nr:S8 family serine peptidase [Pilimelia terevasa]GGK17795.1 hypothetical protein GCM10010124_07950 [Pilimelia terevasa]